MSSSPANRPDYVARVNRVIDHVVRHLDQPLGLEVLADRAGFSPFHFHRVFRSIVGETLKQFVLRLRLERSLYLLSHGGKRSLTDIALECGFASSSDYSRSFKARYDVPPSAFDLEAFRASNRQNLQWSLGDPGTEHLLEQLPAGENPDGFSVVLRELPARQVAYIRILDPYRPDGVPAAAERLVAWAEQRGLADGQWLGYMWDDPDLVAHADCRYDVAVEVPGHFEAEGEVGCLTFPAMCVAQVTVRGGIELEVRAIDWLFETWLPSSPYLPADQPAFEAWIGRPFAHGMTYFELHAQLPVVSLRA